MPKAAKEIKTFTGYVSSDVRFYSKMTTAELLAFTADFHQVKQPKRDSGIDGAFQIDPNKSIAELSLGTRKSRACERLDCTTENADFR